MWKSNEYYKFDDTLSILPAHTATEGTALCNVISVRSFVMSVGLSVRLFTWNNSVPAGRISIKFDIWVFLEKETVEKI